MSRQKQNLLYVLDSFSHRDVKRWKRQYQAISAYCWDHYSYFAHQRSRMADALKTSLLGNSIHLPASFITRAKRLGISAMLPVNTKELLLNTLLREDWRIMPMQFDIPSNPQILGQLAHAVGIEAILYPSVKTHKKCLVIYPENFQQASAYVEIEGDLPKGVDHGRIDRNTFNSFI
ncbi:MAG TPA: hypothetical protein VLI69_00615 [Gammaproteobacteria bacterium]|nr:hypothetical protein [Gammaproteobacteria bacterium]